MDLSYTCSRAYESEANQTLAIVLSIVFCTWIGLSVLLSALQLYAVSSQVSVSQPPIVKAVVTNSEISSSLVSLPS